MERWRNSLENIHLWLDLLLLFGKPKKMTGFEVFVRFAEESKFIEIAITMSLLDKSAIAHCSFVSLH